MATLPVASAGISRRRQVVGAGVLVLGLPLVTGLLVPQRDSESLATPVLLVLSVVVLSGLLGGLWVGLPGALAGGLLLNWFFTVPYGTLVVDRSEQLLVLVVYLAVAGSVSAVVGVAARRTAEATRARAEAQALARVAGAALEELTTLPRLLEQVRTLFGVREVALVERVEQGEGRVWTAVETATGPGQPEPDEAELRVDVDPDLALLVRGPTLFGEDQRVLRSFAEAAANALRGRRLAEQASEAERFRAADEMRTALLAAVGHDLRTPLAGMKAAVTSLRQHDVAWTEQESDELLTAIEDSADRLQRLVANLLDASRLQVGVVSAVLIPVSIEEIIERALVSLGDPPRVYVEAPETLPDALADPGLAERVVANLIDNALRYSPAGLMVTVRSCVVRAGVMCEVVDHGPGVPQQRWNQLFTPFQRFDDRRTDGIGLGLAVAKGFAAAMGSRLEPAETTGGGLTMRFVLPIAGGSPTDGSSSDGATRQLAP